MGLDITLGVVIFLAAIRGWLKGFLYQAIRIVALIACVFLADPVRGQVRPHVAPHFKSIQPEMLDRILWWLAGGVTYIVLVGVVSLLLAIARRPDEDGLKPRSSSGDRFGGFLLGAAKGGLVAAFLTAGVQTYVLGQLSAFPWAEQQVKGSKALVWNETYKPVPMIWQSPPVQHFVGHVQKMGFSAPAGSPPAPPAPAAGRVADRASQASEGRHPRLVVTPSGAKEAGASNSLASEIDAKLDDIKARIDKKPGLTSAD